MGGPTEEEAIVGRGAELGAITSFLDDTASWPCALLLAGEAGIGKSTLWDRAVAEAARRPIRTLWVRPAEAEAQLSYSGLWDLFEPVLDEALPGLPPPQRTALEVALRRTDPEGPSPDLLAVSLAVLGLLKALAAREPVLLAIDDAQWLDPPTGRVLAFAARRLAGAPVGWLASVRTVDGRPLPAPVDALPSAEVIEVGPLSLGALQQVLTSRLGTPLARPAAAGVHQASGGNPFLAIEMARALRESDARVHPGEPLPVPATARELVGERLAGLSGPARRLALLAAALAHPTATVLEAATGDPLLADRHLRQLQRAGVLRREDDRVTFVHPLLASIAYSDTPPGERRAAHRALAAVVEDPEERARHLGLGTEAPDEAVAAALEAQARAALRRGAPDAAVALIELALRLTPPDDADSLTERRLLHAEYLWLVTNLDRLQVQLDELLATVPSGPARARALLLQTLVLEHRGESEASIARVAEEAIAEAAGDPTLAARAHALLTFQLSDVERIQEHGRQAVQLLAGSDADPALRAMALTAMERARLMSGQPLDVAAVERAIELEERAGTTRPEDSARLLLAADALVHEDVDEAVRQLETLRQRSIAVGDDNSLGQMLYLQAQARLWAGEPAAAAELASDALDISRGLGLTAGEAFVLAILAQAQTVLGRVEEAGTNAERSAGIGADAEDPWIEAPGRWALGALALVTGDAAAADRACARGDELVERMGRPGPSLWYFHGDHVEAALALGDVDRAASLLERYEARVAAIPTRPWASGIAARCRGQLLAARGEVMAAAEALDAAVEIHRAGRFPIELGRSLLAAGVVRRRAKRKAPAREALEEALAIFRSLPAPLWAARTEAELSRAGGSRAAPGELTPTERRVADLVAEGRSNAEVATQLFMGVRTVEANLSRVFRKLGVRSRTELARMYARREEDREEAAGRP